MTWCLLECYNNTLKERCFRVHRRSGDEPARAASVLKRFGLESQEMAQSWRARTWGSVT
jgi:hypothetical protein